MARLHPCLLAASGAVLIAALCPAAQADFSNYYDPSNWTLLPSPDGSLDATGAPGSITLIGPDAETNATEIVDLFITAPAAGTFAFDWSYFSADDPEWDGGGYRVNASYVLLSMTSGESGSVSVPVAAGDVIGFAVESVDGFFGPGELTITAFSAPIPEPASLGLLAGAGLLLLTRRRPAG